ncbi:MAG TPA: redoxin domain-containing protein [Sedimentisphaerales bacterium]|nr:redoxin domain-containing protein [Sedimentisphaerales bacterium]
MKSTSIMIIRCTLFVILFTFVGLPAFGEEKKVPAAAQEEARQILQELQHRFQNRPPYQLSFLTKFELLGGARARIIVNQGEKPVTYYTVEGLIRLSGEKLEVFCVAAHLTNDFQNFQKSTETHSVWQDGRGFELRKNLESGCEQAVTTRVKLHDEIRPDSRGWFADGVFIGSNHYSEDLLGVPEPKIARETGIAGGELLRIEGEIPSGTLVVWLNIEKPATLKRASFKANSNFMSQLHGVNAFNLEVEVLEYTKIGEVPFPIKAVATYTYEIPGEPVKLVDRLTTTRREIQVNPDFGSMNAFQIDFPEGTIVEDYEANVKYKWVRGKLQVIEGEPIPLTGKALPELKDLGIDLSPADVNDKVILVCFFDMNQRPSRNCLRQLSKRAQELEAKNVVVISVQSSKIDKNTLNKWIEEQNISFPVGIIEGNEEEIRLTWGVKSLPWLILTDSRHTVRAEGFALAELDEQLVANK